MPKEISRTQHKALNDYKTDLNSVLQCLAETEAYVRPIESNRFILGLATRDQDVNRLKAAPLIKLNTGDKPDLFLEFEQHVEVVKLAVNQFTISTKLTICELWKDESTEFLGWHYHPELNEDPIVFPHLHFFCATQSAVKNDWFKIVHGRHIPTGRVSIEEIAYFLITELGITPTRDDWLVRISNSFKRHEDRKSWGNILPGINYFAARDH